MRGLPTTVLLLLGLTAAGTATGCAEYYDGYPGPGYGYGYGYGSPVLGYAAPGWRYRNDYWVPPPGAYEVARRRPPPPPAVPAPQRFAPVPQPRYAPPARIPAPPRFTPQAQSPRDYYSPGYGFSRRPPPEAPVGN